MQCMLMSKAEHAGELLCTTNYHAADSHRDPKSTKVMPQGRAFHLHVCIHSSGMQGTMGAPQS